MKCELVNRKSGNQVPFMISFDCAVLHYVSSGVLALLFCGASTRASDRCSTFCLCLFVCLFLSFCLWSEKQVVAMTIPWIMITRPWIMRSCCEGRKLAATVWTLQCKVATHLLFFFLFFQESNVDLEEEQPKRKKKRVLLSSGSEDESDWCIPETWGNQVYIEVQLHTPSLCSASIIYYIMDRYSTSRSNLTCILCVKFWWKRSLQNKVKLYVGGSPYYSEILHLQRYDYC